MCINIVTLHYALYSTFVEKKQFQNVSLAIPIGKHFLVPPLGFHVEPSVERVLHGTQKRFYLQPKGFYMEPKGVLKGFPMGTAN